MTIAAFRHGSLSPTAGEGWGGEQYLFTPAFSVLPSESMLQKDELRDPAAWYNDNDNDNDDDDDDGGDDDNNNKK